MNKKWQVWLPLFFSLVMIVGMFVGYKLQGKSVTAKGFFNKTKEGSLQEALNLIKMKYVDSLPLASLERKAIQDLINELDPHSVYIPPVDLKKVNEELAGSFEGIGVEYQVFDDTITVLYVMPNGPSNKAGLLTGDQILSVNDSLLTGKTPKVDLLRGDGGSQAHLVIKRGTDIKNITVTRGTVPVSSVEAAFLLNDTTGFIKLSKFTHRTYREFMESLEHLLANGMRALILDLRGNGGGFMQEAVEIADEFLDQDKLIVYTEGINSKKKEYRCKRPGLFEKGKLTILIDELSASASEVLAGALQDWCRAEIIGRRSFGKGLVQEQYALSDGGALRLTIARYYTPVGRSIQKPYDQGKKVYMDDIWNRYSSGEMTTIDSSKIANGSQLKTVCGTAVYGGGGIAPNLFIPIDTTNAQRKAFSLLTSSESRKYLHQYYLSHIEEINSYQSPLDFLAAYSAEDEKAKALFNNFPDKKRLSTLTPKEKQYFQQYLLAQLSRYRWYNTAYYEVLYQNDDMVRKALQ